MRAKESGGPSNRREEEEEENANVLNSVHTDEIYIARLITYIEIKRIIIDFICIDTII